MTAARVIAAAGAPRPGHPACRDRSVPYIGKTITIEFTGKETLGGGYTTSFLEDDNALNVS